MSCSSRFGRGTGHPRCATASTGAPLDQQVVVVHDGAPPDVPPGQHWRTAGPAGRGCTSDLCSAPRKNKGFFTAHCARGFSLAEWHKESWDEKLVFMRCVACCFVSNLAHSMANFLSKNIFQLFSACGQEGRPESSGHSSLCQAGISNEGHSSSTAIGLSKCSMRHRPCRGAMLWSDLR